MEPGASYVFQIRNGEGIVDLAGNSISGDKSTISITAAGCKSKTIANANTLAAADEGATANILCNSGYDVNDNTWTCSNGVWSGESCSGICPAVSIANGTLNQRLDGETDQIICESGFVTPANTTWSCIDGNWDGDGCNPSGVTASVSIPTEAVCGNGVVETGEVCDDGNLSDLDACLSTCKYSADVTIPICSSSDPRTIIIEPGQYNEATLKTLITDENNQYDIFCVKPGDYRHEIPIVRVDFNVDGTKENPNYLVLFNDANTPFVHPADETVTDFESKRAIFDQTIIRGSQNFVIAGLTFRGIKPINYNETYGMKQKDMVDDDNDPSTPDVQYDQNAGTKINIVEGEYEGNTNQGIIIHKVLAEFGGSGGGVVRGYGSGSPLGSTDMNDNFVQFSVIRESLKVMQVKPLENGDYPIKYHDSCAGDPDMPTDFTCKAIHKDSHCAAAKEHNRFVGNLFQNCAGDVLQLGESVMGRVVLARNEAFVESSKLEKHQYENGFDLKGANRTAVHEDFFGAFTGDLTELDTRREPLNSNGEFDYITLDTTKFINSYVDGDGVIDPRFIFHPDDAPLVIEFNGTTRLNTHENYPSDVRFKDVRQRLYMKKSAHDKNEDVHIVENKFWGFRSSGVFDASAVKQHKQYIHYVRNTVFESDRMFNMNYGSGWANFGSLRQISVVGNTFYNPATHEQDVNAYTFNIATDGASHFDVYYNNIIGSTTKFLLMRREANTQYQ